MYPGYVATGQGNPFEGGTWTEIINNNRAYAYAANAGICWLRECNDCPETSTVTPGVPPEGFRTPALDGAPWYDPNNPDTWGFLGIVGIEITGDESSTRQAAVTTSISGGGVIGPAYYGPRTLVMRVIAIAEEECALQAGLDWLRAATGAVENVCGGDSLTFFDCCPCTCDDDTPAGPCWVEVYRELRTDPDACDPDWWPATYAELKNGPDFATTEDWCTWVQRYWQLANGFGDWSCCVNACVFPYLRQYHNVMLTEGPILLRKPSMNSGGAMAELELTYVAADPAEYALTESTGMQVGSKGAFIPGSGPAPAGAAVLPYIDEAPPDPFAPQRSALAVLRPRMPRVESETGWSRLELTTRLSTFGSVLSSERISVTLRTGDDQAERIRVGVWLAGERLAGYVVPFIPPRSILTIDGVGRGAHVLYNGESRPLRGFVKAWNGTQARFPDLPHASFRVTVDQEVGKEVELRITTAATPVGSM